MARYQSFPYNGSIVTLFLIRKVMPISHAYDGSLLHQVRSSIFFTYIPV